jgi:hypothetical protein
VIKFTFGHFTGHPSLFTKGVSNEKTGNYH